MKATRRGFGIPTMMAGMVPVLVLTVSMAHSFQASSVRRFTSSAWNSYLAAEIAESAIAEAEHRVKAADLFQNAGDEAGFTQRFVAGLMAGQLPGVPADKQEVWALTNAQGQEVGQMVVAASFPPTERPVALGGVARAAALENGGVKLGDNDLTVTVRAITFRREWISAENRWITWGVMEFRARVKIDSGNGPGEHVVTATKLYTLNSIGPGDVLRYSDRNLRTSVRHPGAAS